MEKLLDITDINYSAPCDLICLTQILSRLFEFLLCHCQIKKATSENRPLIVGITGDGGLGKSTLAGKVATFIKRAFVVSTDGFLLDREQRRIWGGFSGDDPRAVDLNALVNTVTKISNREGVVTPKVYDHTTGQVYEVYGNSVLTEDIRILLVEGAFALHPYLRPFLDFGIFLDAEYSVRYALRLQVDTLERGYSLIEFQKNWPHYARLYEEVIRPNATVANLIIYVTHNRSYIVDPTEIHYCLHSHDILKRR